MEPIRAQVHSPAAYADRITHLVTVAGLRPTPSVGLALLVVDHDDATATDQWLVDSLPHLVMRVSPSSIRLGPFVQPGVTACLRCLQMGGATTLPAVAADDEVDPALLMAALGWAVHDLATWHSQEVPSTWSSSITLTPDLRTEVERWPRHPHCGCSWGLADHLADRLAQHRAG